MNHIQALMDSTNEQTLYLLAKLAAIKLCYPENLVKWTVPSEGCIDVEVYDKMDTGILCQKLRSVVPDV